MRIKTDDGQLSRGVRPLIVKGAGGVSTSQTQEFADDILTITGAGSNVTVVETLLTVDTAIVTINVPAGTKTMLLTWNAAAASGGDQYGVLNIDDVYTDADFYGWNLTSPNATFVGSASGSQGGVFAVVPELTGSNWGSGLCEITKPPIESGHNAYQGYNYSSSGMTSASTKNTPDLFQAGGFRNTAFPLVPPDISTLSLTCYDTTLTTAHNWTAGSRFELVCFT